MGDKHDATESLLGYLFQCRYALLAALQEVKRNPGHELSIERVDDIAFHSTGTPFELIQTKHHSKPGVISDKGTDIWKTLGVWIDRVKGDPQLASQSRFILLTTATSEDGSACSHLRATGVARDVEAARAALEVAAKKSANKTTKGPREAFLKLDVAEQKLLLSNVWVFDRARNISDVRQEIEVELSLVAPPNKVGVFVDHLEGWWIKRIVVALAGIGDGLISLSTLQGKIADIRDGFKIDNLPLDAEAEALTTPEDTDESRTYVRQMRLIALKGQHASAAIRDFQRAFVQRSRWLREDLLIDGEVERYDRTLRDAWSRKLGSMDDEFDGANAEIKEKLGRDLFHWANQHGIPLRNRDELWLSAGSFQMLADRLEVGWHVDFTSLLTKPEEEQ